MMGLITNRTAILPGDYKRQGNVPRAKRVRNKWEQLYSLELEALKRAGDVLQYEYEGLTFRLADGAKYKPDFVVWLPNSTLRLVELKGHRREAAIVRFKVAKEKYPHCGWWMLRREGGGWVHTPESEGYG